MIENGPAPHDDLERIVDELEEKIVGDVVDQARDDDEPDPGTDPPRTGSAAESSG